MKSFKQQCIELRLKDKTLNEIVKITGRSKTSVYFHIKDIQLSTRKRAEISENSRQLALKISGARKGKSLRPFKPFTTWTPKLVLLVAHLMFDGEILKKKCVYHNRSLALVKRVEGLMSDVYDFPAKIAIDKKSGVRRVQYHNVELANFLYQRALELQRNIAVRSLDEQREFVRAFFDDEGCMDVRLDRKLRRIRGYQNNKQILQLVKRLLKNFDIDSRLQSTNEIVISGKENLKKFQREINFSEGVCLNPKRTNSIWKRNIEKRELLDLAIRSFKT